MQTIFLLLTTIIIAIIAKKRGRNLWGWGILGGVIFLVIDTLAALILTAVLWNTISTSNGTIYIFAAVKLVLSGIIIAGFNANLKPAAVLPPEQPKDQS